MSKNKKSPKEKKNSVHLPEDKFHLFIALALYLIAITVQLWNLRYVSAPMTDEGDYLYASKLISEGYLPYKDFYVGHPPLGMFIISLFFYIFGIHLHPFRLIYTLLIESIIFPIFYLVKKRANSVFPAVFASVLFITFVEFQQVDARFYAHRQSALFLASWGLLLYFNSEKKIIHFLGGFLLSLGCSITFAYGFIYAPLIIGIFIAHRRENLFSTDKMFIAGLITGILPVLFIFFFPGAWECLVTYNSAYRPVGFPFKKKLYDFIVVFKASPWLFILGYTCSILPYNKLSLSLSFANFIGLLLTVLLPKSFYPHYYAILGPTLSISSGLIVARLISNIKIKKLVKFVIIILILYCYFFQFRPYLSKIFFYQKNEAYYELISELQKYKGKTLLTIQPNYALDSGLDITFYRYVVAPRFLYALEYPHFLSLVKYDEMINKKADLILWEYRINFCADPKTKEYIIKNFIPVWGNDEGVILLNPAKKE
ncbi:MAG TPA: glycosyltransferase family 39 protein [Candidatus Eremiobacteraeota bacterium]|nr:glycosyltransferase family 39 protein [Candidatus Eremiobacteraeota bacterium]